jgi:hypothetical protein
MPRCGARKPGEKVVRVVVTEVVEQQKRVELAGLAKPERGAI